MFYSLEFFQFLLCAKLFPPQGHLTAKSGILHHLVPPASPNPSLAFESQLKKKKKKPSMGNTLLADHHSAKSRLVSPTPTTLYTSSFHLYLNNHRYCFVNVCLTCYVTSFTNTRFLLLLFTHISLIHSVNFYWINE